MKNISKYILVYRQQAAQPRLLMTDVSSQSCLLSVVRHFASLRFASLLAISHGGLQNKSSNASVISCRNLSYESNSTTSDLLEEDNSRKRKEECQVQNDKCTARSENVFPNNYCMSTEKVNASETPSAEGAFEALNRGKESLLLHKKHGPIIASLLQKTYHNLVRNEHLHYNVSQASQDGEDQANQLSANEKREIHGNDVIHISQSSHADSRRDKPPVCSFPIDESAQEHSLLLSRYRQKFHQKMFLKYQRPSSREAGLLTKEYGEAEDLVRETVSPFIAAGVISSCSPCVTSHLKGFYWKASLSLYWPVKIGCTGMHPVKEEAVRRAYLLLCVELKKVGLICRGNDGRWTPLKCDQVVSMLDQLARYGEITVGSSRGRGSKIVLEQLKGRREGDIFTINHKAVPAEQRKRLKRCQQMENDTKKVLTEDCFETYKGQGYNTSHDMKKESEKLFSGNDRDNSLQKSVTLKNLMDDTNRLLDFEPSTLEIDSSMSSGPLVDEVGRSMDKERLSKDLKWKCTVHVGWPLPFSVYSYGVSLPSAQMVGYMAVATKLKLYDLLTKCNNQVCGLTLEHHIVNETLKQWGSQSLLWNSDDVAEFEADAEIFCDASNDGFGAYLLQKDTQKVSWISECWKNQPNVLHKLCTKNGQYLHSTQAELFALVTAVFSWKKKLRHKKVLIFSDNMTSVCMVNTYGNTSVTSDMCVDSNDYLIQVLQFTRSVYFLQLKAVWLQRDRNQLADHLSRQDLQFFRRALPNAALNKTKAKKLKIHGNSFWADGL
ncbi:uncharacterized protein LOC101849443 [Aplysia californica]|uniref:Uncharacterized protein LOC101849443 n=1 Tax=Aplysia californica TaxID=6500 RepID=A0ABM0JHE7_APLCA|nr:uncharacterized protein LOC101849443 [Aplysia californica]